MLFLSSLLAATLLPGGSEALFLYQLQQGDNPWLLVMVAGCGNLLGSIVTYAMGYAGGNLLSTHPATHRLLPSPQQLGYGRRLFIRWGYPTLLFIWLPVVGDGIAMVAGVLRTPLTWFVILAGIGKFGRYAALTLLC
ncbi:MAG: DedA family protein [Mariprofundales bacterium]|nr:DedA family protein [Mariprofundales bacterium]